MMSPAVRATPRSLAMIECYKIPPERITVIPRAVDTATFSPAAVSADHIASLRRNWGVLPQTRVVLVPSRIAPRNGQITVIDVARLLVGGGDRNVAFVFAGDGMVVAALEPPLTGRAVVEAQALGRPAIATTVGVLPENVLCPPRMRDELRTGWLVRPGDVGQPARANSPNSCFFRKALPKPFAGSIRRSWHAIADAQLQWRG